MKTQYKNTIKSIILVSITIIFSSCFKKPEAIIYCNDTTGSPCELMHFYNRSEHAKKFHLDFGDNTSIDEEGTYGISHAYSEIGTYTVILTAYDRKIEKGDTHTITVTITENETGTFTDTRDGKIYKTVKIDNRVWMAENLNYDCGTGCYDYDNDTANSEIYGKLYDWETANIVAPPDWHLPTKMEWEALSRFYGSSASGGALKARGIDYWKSPNTGATNCSGFNALPGGYYNFPSLEIGTNCVFWTSEENGASAVAVMLEYNDERIDILSFSQELGCSVRCISDELFLD